ncbi:MAG: tetratricopeptide repeat protein [Acidobacteria bacterium]|nr:tetratricopeptide repeat protein [Acidobacteriota bacterium]
MKQVTNQTRVMLLLLTFASWSIPSWSMENQSQALQSGTQQPHSTHAAEAWSNAAKAHPLDPIPLANLGLLEARQGHYPQAIVLYRKAMALQPSLPGLRLNMGLAYFKDSQFEEAIRTLTPLLKSPSTSPAEMQRLTFLMGMSHYGLGEFKAAALDLQQSADNDPQNLPLLLTLAHSCLLSQQYACVVDTYHRMVVLNPKSAEADMLVGEALDEMKDMTGATKEFRAAVEANPKEPNVHFGLGYLLWKQVQYSEAAQQFQAELANNPQYTQANLYLADTYLRMDNLNDAKSILEKVVKTDPNIYMGRLDLGIVFQSLGHTQHALREFKAATLLKPDEVNAHMRLGRLYRSMGKTADAQQEFNVARGLNRATDEGLSHVLNSTSQSNKASATSASVE